MSQLTAILVEEVVNAVQQVNTATAMKKILLVTLLSIAMSENILVEDYLRPRMAWMRNKQLGDRNIKRIPRNDISSEIEELSNYDNDRQQISDTQFISEARKLPSMAVIRRTDVAQFPQIDLLSSEKSKFESTKPAILISIDIQEGKKADGVSQQDCSTRKIYRKHNQDWQIPQPFYVEEPRWVEVNPDYVDASPRHDGGDPYILSRGKKNFRIKDPEQVDRTIEDFKEFLEDYPGRSRRPPMKIRVRRSIDMNEKSQSKITDDKDNQGNEINHYNSVQGIDRDTNNIAMKRNWGKSSKINKLFEGGNKKIEKKKNMSYDVFIKKHEKDKLKNLAKRSSREFKFIKQNQTIVNDITTNFMEEKQKVQRDDISNDTENGNSELAKISQDRKLNNRKNHFNTDMNKRKKRSVLLKNREFPETHKKYKTREIDASFENFERNETNLYKQMKNKAYIDELDNLSPYDYLFVSSRGKQLDGRTKSSNKKDTNRNQAVERPRNTHEYSKELESEEEAKNEENKSEIDKDNIGMMVDSQLEKKSNSESSKIKNYSNYRRKRSACQNLTCKIEPLQDQVWLKNIEREIQDLRRRDKHSDILEGLKMGEPYIISRGKKSRHEYKNELYSVLKSQDTDDADRSEVLSLQLAKNLLRILSMETFRCNNDNCDINANQLPSKRSPRDRRGTLEEILAAYDPYYVARGKRASPDNTLTKMQSL